MLHGTVESNERVARWWFTDRLGGRSIEPYAARNLAAHVGDDPARVRANREGLELELGAGVLSWMGPVHGTDIVQLESPHAITPNVDALATTVAAVPLVTLGADCVPVLIAGGDVIIAAHIGWRGFVDGMTMQLQQHLRANAVDPATAQVLLGPSICGACYGISDERAALIEAVCPDAMVTARNGQRGADLRRGLAAQWAGVGVTVRVVGPCTAEDDRYFSHRRDGVTGRQAGVIAWTN